MSNIDTGGPAFPTNRVNMIGEVVPDEEGMTLRDYFAAKAMDGFNREMVAFEWGEDVTAHAAKRAYEIADAMLKARKQ